jgi:hypothetical protein
MVVPRVTSRVEDVASAKRIVDDGEEDSEHIDLFVEAFESARASHHFHGSRCGLCHEMK